LELSLEWGEEEEEPCQAASELIRGLLGVPQGRSINRKKKSLHPATVIIMLDR
jgi:hypothetical protein